MNDQLKPVKTKGMLQTKKHAFLMCPTSPTGALGGTPSASDEASRHIKKAAARSSTRGSGWISCFDAAVEGLHGLVLADAAVIDLYVAFEKVIDDEGEENESGEDADAPDDDLLIELEHGLRRLGGEGRFLVCADQLGGQVLACQCCENPVRDAGWQLVRPLVDGLVGHPDCGGGCGDGAAEQFNGFGFTHALLNHSSRRCATIVFGKSASLATMVDAPKLDSYQGRLVHALSLAGETEASLAKHLHVTYQAVKKLTSGTSGAFKADNHVKAARYLKINSDWLALGEGEPRSTTVWPFKSVTPAEFFQVDPALREAAENVLLGALRDQGKWKYEKNNQAADESVRGRRVGDKVTGG